MASASSSSPAPGREPASTTAPATGAPLPPSSAIAHAIVSRDPRTGEEWATRPAATGAHVDAAVARARAAQPAWGARTPKDRARIVERFRAVLYARRRDAVALMEREVGKHEIEGSSEVMITLDLARFYARRAPAELRARRYRPESIALARKRVSVTHEPYGVVAVISPWNYPLMLAASHVLPALVGGNAVLLKPSELSTAVGLLLGEMLVEAGVPADVVQVLPGAGPTGSALVGSAIDKVFFTGSEATGRSIAMACAPRLLPYTLELGGSDPAVVLDDADLDIAARGIAWGRFYNGGQSCVAPKRVFVASSVHEAFLERLAAQVSALRAGDDVAAPISDAQRRAVQSQLDDAVARGATVHAIGGRSPAGENERFLAPVVLTGLSDDMRVMHEETFGPVLPVVPVRDDDEAVERANATSFGLSASVWSRDAGRARRVAARLHTGSVAINDVLVTAGMADVPHGGVKGSGTGRMHGIAGLRECVRERAVVEERLPGTPQGWWFGYSAAMARSVDAFLGVAHAPTARERAASVVRLGALAKRLLGRR